jgi:hypothetical protein
LPTIFVFRQLIAEGFYVSKLSSIEFRRSSGGAILVLASVTGRKAPYYFNTIDLGVILQGLQRRRVDVDTAYRIIDEQGLSGLAHANIA